MQAVRSTSIDSDPTVSVVIAAYNMAQYVTGAIESVLNQTYSNLDVHVIDDGSTDDTRAVVSRINDARVHYYWQSNAGQTRAKNAGIARSRGEFIAFCDADDCWAPHKLAVQLPKFADHEEVGVVYSRRCQMMADGKLLEDDTREFYSGRITEQLFKDNFITFGTAVVRRRCLQELGVFDESYRMGIDWELWLRISTKYEFAFVDDVTYMYRVWPGQMSSNWRGRYQHAFRIMEAFLDRYPGLLSAGVIREAYAHSYASRGRLRAIVDGDYGNGLRDAVAALRHDFTFIPAWKLLARIMLLASRLSRVPKERR